MSFGCMRVSSQLPNEALFHLSSTIKYYICDFMYTYRVSQQVLISENLTPLEIRILNFLSRKKIVKLSGDLHCLA